MSHIHDEVKVIVGLDVEIPVFYKQLTPIKATTMTCIYRMFSLATLLGLLRFVTKTAEKSIRACGEFSEKEISIYNYMFIHNSFTKNMLNIVKCCQRMP